MDESMTENISEICSIYKLALCCAVLFPNNVDDVFCCPPFHSFRSKSSGADVILLLLKMNPRNMVVVLSTRNRG